MKLPVGLVLGGRKLRLNEAFSGRRRRPLAAKWRRTPGVRLLHRGLRHEVMVRYLYGMGNDN
jgi:hypothetical protein